MFSRLLGANAALGVVAYELYGGGKEALGKAAALTGLGPLFYSGGPGLEDLRNIQRGGSKMWTGGVETAIGDDADVGKKHVMQGFRQAMKATPIPFRGAVQDLNKYLLGEEK